MEMFGTGMLITVCLFVLFSATSGLRCFQCKDVAADSSNGLVKRFIKAVSSDNRYCKLSVNEDTPDVEIVTCPQPAAGKVVKCAHIMGRSVVSFGLLNTDVALEFNARSCLQVDASERDGCRKSKDSVQDKSFLSTILTITSVVFDSYDGTTCLCSVSISGDQCNGQTMNSASILSYPGRVLFVLGLCQMILKLFFFHLF